MGAAALGASLGAMANRKVGNAVTPPSSGIKPKDIINDLKNITSLTGAIGLGELAHALNIPFSDVKNIIFDKANNIFTLNGRPLTPAQSDILRTNTAMKYAGIGLAVVGGAFSAWDAWNAPAQTTGGQIANTTVSIGASVGGYFASKAVSTVVTTAVVTTLSKGAGAKIGGVIGTFIPIPIVGTLVGAAAGAGVGWLIGQASSWAINNGVGDMIADAARSSIANHINTVQAVGNVFVSGARAVTNWFRR
jgi:hypothetical protein